MRKVLCVLLSLCATPAFAEQRVSIPTDPLPKDIATSRVVDDAMFGIYTWIVCQRIKSIGGKPFTYKESTPVIQRVMDRFEQRYKIGLGEAVVNRMGDHALEIYETFAKEKVQGTQKQIDAICEQADKDILELQK